MNDHQRAQLEQQRDALALEISTLEGRIIEAQQAAEDSFAKRALPGLHEQRYALLAQHDKIHETLTEAERQASDTKREREAAVKQARRLAKDAQAALQEFDAIHRDVIPQVQAAIQRMVELQQQLAHQRNMYLQLIAVPGVPQALDAAGVEYSALDIRWTGAGNTVYSLGRPYVPPVQGEFATLLFDIVESLARQRVEVEFDRWLRQQKPVVG